MSIAKYEAYTFQGNKILIRKSPVTDDSPSAVFWFKSINGNKKILNEIINHDIFERNRQTLRTGSYKIYGGMEFQGLIPSHMVAELTFNYASILKPDSRKENHSVNSTRDLNPKNRNTVRSFPKNYKTVSDYDLLKICNSWYERSIPEFKNKAKILGSSDES